MSLSKPLTVSASAATKQRLTASSAFMQNYVVGEIVSPTTQFEALQTSDGHALLFRLGSSGVLEAIEEQSGTIHTGWKVHPLTPVPELDQFPDATILNFDATHHVLDDSIGLIMVAGSHAGHNDHLLVSLRNSKQDLSWLADPMWKMVPFSVDDEKPSPISIVGTMFAESSGKKQVVIVDIQKPFEDAVTRYHVSVAANGRARWAKHDTTVVIKADQYLSVVGRAGKQEEDGVYTATVIGGQAQLVYEPINQRGEGPVSPVQLRLPGIAVPSALSVVRNADDGTTDLYVVVGDTLYRFGAHEQTDGAEPVAVLTSELLAGTKTLRATIGDGSIVVWGKNSQKHLFYTASLAEQAGTPEAWDIPMLIRSGVDRASPYVNSTDGGVTIFTAEGDQFQKVIRGSAATGGVWRDQDIHVAPSSNHVKSTAIQSYTTVINVMEEDKDLPAPKTGVKLSANTRSPVYINGTYHVLLSTPVEVLTDATGSLTVVEPTKDLCSTILTASIGDCSITISPKDATFAKLVALNSVDKLRDATVPKRIAAGGVDGSLETIPLVHDSMADEYLALVARHMDILKEAYTQLGDKSALRSDGLPHNALDVDGIGREVDPAGGVRGVGDFGIANLLGPYESDGVVYFDLGDVGNWLKGATKVVVRGAGDLLKTIENTAQNGVHTVASAIQKAADGTLYLAVKIGGEVHKAYLNSKEALAGAAQAVWATVKTSINAFIQFISDLFHWQNVAHTKDVVKKIMMSWLRNEVANIHQVKQQLHGVMNQVKDRIGAWGKVGDWAPKINDATNLSTAASRLDSLTPQARFFADKFRDHGKNLQIKSDLPRSSDDGSLLATLAHAVTAEGHVLQTAAGELSTVAAQLGSKSIQDILKALVAVLGESLLSSCQVVMDALLDVLQQLANSALDMLDAKIHIPVISDILGAIGVPELSLIDLFAWIGALAMTVTYAFTEGRAPFVDNGAAGSASSLVSDEPMAVSEGVSAGAGGGSVSVDFPDDWSELEKLFVHGHVSDVMWRDVYQVTFMLAGIFRWVGIPFQAIEAEAQSGSGWFGTVSAVIGICSAACNGAGKILTPLCPIESKPFAVHSMITTGTVVATKVYFSGLAKWALGKVNAGSLTLDNNREFGAIVDAALAFHGAVDTVWHCYELSSKSHDDARKAALMDEASNMEDYLSRILYAMAVNDPDEFTRNAGIAAMSVVNFIYTGVKIDQALTGKSARHDDGNS